MNQNDLKRRRINNDAPPLSLKAEEGHSGPDNPQSPIVPPQPTAAILSALTIQPSPTSSPLTVAEHLSLNSLNLPPNAMHPNLSLSNLPPTPVNSLASCGPPPADHGRDSATDSHLGGTVATGTAPPPGVSSSVDVGRPTESPSGPAPDSQLAQVYTEPEGLLETPIEPLPKTDAFGVDLLPRIAEKEGFNLGQFEEGVWETLAVAVEYKLRTLVDEALRICRRHLDRQSELCLDSRSVLLALKLLRWEKVPPASLRSRDGDRKSLQEYIEQDMNVPVPLLPKLSVKWVSVNNTIINPEFARNTLHDQTPAAAWHYVSNHQAFKRDFINTQSTSKFVMSVVFDDHSLDPDHGSATRILAIPQGLMDALEEEQRLFLERISSVLTAAIQDTQQKGDDAQRAQIRVALDKVIRSLSEGHIPQSLVPYLLTLICGEICSVVLDGTPEGVLVLLDLLRAMAQNQSIQLHAYLHQLLQALFTCMLTPLIGGASSTAIHSAIGIRRTAAEILASIVNHSAAVSGSPVAYSSAVEIISEVLSKPSLPLPTLLGAIWGAKALGPTAIKRCVTPVSRDLIEALKMSLKEASPNMEVAEIRELLKSSMLELLLACTNLGNVRHSGQESTQNTDNSMHMMI